MFIGKLAFAATGALAGISLARTARRTGGFPPEAWASAMVFIGGVGLISFAVGDAIGAETSALVRAAIIGGDLFERLALSLLYLFVWLVFRRRERWATGATAVGIALLAMSFAFELTTGNLPHHDSRSLAYRTSQLVFALPFLWSAAETRLTHLRIRKQVSLGLADPMVCNRFLLWSAATAAFAGNCLAAWAASTAGATGHGGLEGAFSILRGVLYFLVAVTIAIGFHPPAAYRRFVSRSAPPPGP
jgi:hypothetical protein